MLPFRKDINSSFYQAISNSWANDGLAIVLQTSYKGLQDMLACCLPLASTDYSNRSICIIHSISNL